MRPSINVLGASEVGKTGLIWRYTIRTAVYQNDPTWTSCYRDSIQIGDKIFEFELVDSRGDISNEQKENFIMHGDGFILVAAADSRKSMKELQKLAEKIQTIREDKPPTIVVLNKQDIEEKRKVTTFQLESLANSFNFDFYEISVYLDLNVDFVMDKMHKMVLAWKGIEFGGRKKNCVTF